MKESWHLLAGWLLDGSGSRARSRMLLRIEHGWVVSVEPVPGSDLPTAGLLDLSHCTILPGLVDAHVHLCLSGTRDVNLRQAQMGLAWEQARQVIAGHLADHIAHGIMALRDAGDYGAYALRFKARMLPEGRFPLEMRCSGHGWHARGRYGSFIGCAPARGERLDEAVRRCEERVDQLKIVHSGVNSLIEFGRPTAPQFPLEELRAAVAVASARGLQTMVHANGVLPVREAVDAGCHSIEHGYFMGRENLEKLAQGQVAWVPTVIPMASYARASAGSPEETGVAFRTVEHHLEQLNTARKLGVNVVLGTDSGSLGVEHGKAVVEELKLLGEAGYALEEALECATTHGARLLGVEDRVGRVKAGMPASFVAVEGSPEQLLESLSAPRGVWVQGRMVRCMEEEKRV